MQYLLTKEELDSVSGEVRKEALAYIEVYKDYVYKRAEAAISFAKQCPHYEAPDRFVSNKLKQYDADHPEPPLPSCLK